ncbi:MAG: DUF2911 domain-containing protein [Gemmatimonadota bacterium]
MTRSTALSTLAFTLVLAAACEAQPPASQHGTVSQTVNGTTIVLEYDRPVLRGRSVFGDILDYDVVWTPGANRTTWVDFSTPVTVEGVELEAGRYGIWAIPQENGPWEVILTREWDTHHSFFPAETEAARVSVSPEPSAHMEALAFYFPVVGPYETTLRFHWGEIVLPLSISVPE